MLRTGTKLGDFRILGHLGSGAMGDVYRARDSRLDRDVALKVLREELASDTSRRRRFQQEARAASSLNHPNIVTIHAVGEDDGCYFIAMELIEGRTLRQCLAEGSVAPAELADIGRQLASGLAKAHEAGIVHRDLKPENIMVTPDGLVKILDFGLAKLSVEADTASSAETRDMLTEPGAVVGTVAYMAPEQAAGKPVDFRADQFALGAILYEAAAGRRAFQADTPAQTLAAIIEREPEPLATINPQVPKELTTIVDRCLSKSPSRRYASTRQLVSAFAHLDEPSSKSYYKLFAAASVVVLVLGLGFLKADLGRLFLSETATRDGFDSIAVLPLDNLSGDPEEDYFADGMTEALIAALAKIESLKVISRTSVMRYKNVGRRPSLPVIARELDVEVIVEGSVLRVGDRVRITAQLIDAETDRHLWAENYERDVANVLLLQSEVARSIAEQIHLELSSEEVNRMTAEAGPVDPEAYEAYLKGWYFWNKVTAGDIERSVEFFEQAIELDPGWAPAYQGLAAAYHLLASGSLIPDLEGYPKAKVAVLKALELDPDLAAAHASFGFITYLYDWNFELAEDAFRRALELDPNSADAHHTYALFLSDMGRLPESIEQMRMTVQLDPLNLLALENLGWCYVLARRYRDASTTFEMMTDLDPGWLSDGAPWVAFLEGRTLEAIDALEELAEKNPEEDYIWSSLGFIAGRAGEPMKAREVLAKLEELEREQYVSPIRFAEVHSGSGNADEAMTFLETAYERHEDELLGLNTWPVWDPIRHDSRFQNLVRRLGLPEK